MERQDFLDARSNSDDQSFLSIEMLYLQGIGKERFVFWNTVAASIPAGVSALGRMSMGLLGIYLGIFLQYDSCHTIYQAEERKMMWYQKDWFTGIDYYNLKEKQIHVAEQRITKPVEQQFHEQMEIYYVKAGMQIFDQRRKFHVQAGSFFCLSMHLFYHIETIRKPLHCVKVSFHIGLFMFLCFEKRQTRENEILMYGVQPILLLKPGTKAGGTDSGRAFGGRTGNSGFQRKTSAFIWRCKGTRCIADMPWKSGQLIRKEAAGLECDSESSFGYEQDGFLEEYAREAGMSLVTLNRNIEKQCDIHFFSSRRWEKIYNAGALL